MTEVHGTTSAREIFFVSNNVDEIGGVTTWTHQMARLFSQRGHTVHVVGVVPAPEDQRADLGESLPYTTVTLYDVHPAGPAPRRGLTRVLHPGERLQEAARAAGMREQSAKLSALFRTAGPGAVIIVTQVWAMEWVALADTRGLPVVGMTHESFETCRRSSRFRRVQRFYKDVDRMLALTREDADLWIGQGLNNVGSMPNPLPFLPDTPSERTEKRVVSIGRLHEEKGVDLLLDSWAEIASDHPSWTLSIYGSGPEEEALKKQAAHLGIAASVEWKGRTDNVLGALRESSVFALSSRGEGFPLAPMEAMATAVPCVAFGASPGVREIITHEEDGLIAPAGNTRAFAQHLDRMICDQDLRDRMGEQARRNIHRFSPERVVGRWESLFALLYS
ncbi:glycosyltransferase [Streptomyces sp. NPDC005481]|uniref:glycosyltransferase n=1 Tax=Streptomyces sp. NPDC005481 TaxID=3154881 RepID=UPI0033B34734